MHTPTSTLVSLRRIVTCALVVVVAQLATAQQVNWTGGTSGANSNFFTTGNWSPSGVPGATNDVYITTANGADVIPTLTVGQNLSVRSFYFDNSAGRYGANGLRIATTTSLTNNNQTTIFFNTAGTIITAVNNATVAFRSASLSNPSTATPLPSMTLNLNYTGTGIVNVDATSMVRVDEVLGGVPAARITGTGALEKTGEGLLRFQGGNTFSGGFTLTEGIVEYTGSGSVADGAIVSSPFGLGTVRFNGGTVRSTTTGGRTIYNGIELAGNVAITTDVTGYTGNFTISALGGGATTLLSDSTLNISQTVNWHQVIAGNHSLTKTGAGTLVLTAENTSTGMTIVDEGTLRLQGSLAGGLHVGAAATFAGTGPVYGNVTIAGLHSPGNSPGIQEFGGNLTYLAGAAVAWELNGNTVLQGETPVFDQVMLGGTLDFAGATLLSLTFNAAGSTVNWTDSFWSANQAWEIYSAAAVSGFDNLSLETGNWIDASGNYFNDVLAGASFSLIEQGGSIYLSYAAIPEPSTYAVILGALAAAALVWQRRRPARS